MAGWAIVGCGMIAKFHARAIQDMKGDRLVACYSRDEARGIDFAKTYGGVPYNDLGKMLANPRSILSLFALRVAHTWSLVSPQHVPENMSSLRSHLKSQ